MAEPARDALDESHEETFLVEITGVLGGTVGTLGTTTVKILDDDPPPVLSVSDRQVSETGGSAVLTVSLAGGTEQQVTVQYATANGSATSPSDFTASSRSLTFAPGVTTQPITVPIANDSAEEFVEHFTVTLSNPTNATLGTATATVSILDDDRVQAVVKPDTACEGTENSPHVSEVRRHRASFRSLCVLLRKLGSVNS